MRNAPISFPRFAGPALTLGGLVILLALVRYPLVTTPLILATAEIGASDPGIGDGFGESVDLHGGRAVVGAPFDDDAGRDSGSAYVFVRQPDGWRQEAKLIGNDTAAGDWFGGSDPFNSAVAIWRDRIVIGAHRDDDAGDMSGSAYIFVRTHAGWVQEQKITASDATAFDRFGNSVALDDGTAVVGAFTSDPVSPQAGAAYVFAMTEAGWVEKQKITASDAGVGDQFGSSVAISGGTILVSAYKDATRNERMGSAYVFERNDSGVWTETAKLVPADGGLNDLFGYHIALHGDTAVIGSPLHDAAGVDSGAVYVFVRTKSGWAQQAKLVPSDPAAGDVFGYDVDVDGDRIVAGAVFDDTPAGTHGGSAYLFQRGGTTWAEVTKVEPFDGAAGDTFGDSVAIDGPWILFGSEFHDHTATDAGAAYLLWAPRVTAQSTWK